LLTALIDVRNAEIIHLPWQAFTLHALQQPLEALLISLGDGIPEQPCAVVEVSDFFLRKLVMLCR